ncbi:MAG: CoA ester lyase [Anaerolineae bacterium]
MPYDERIRRVLLFMPGDDLRKIARGAQINVDSVIMDLEDGVALSAKEKARSTILQALTDPGLDFGRVERLVRLNSWDSGMQADDLAATIRGKPDGYVVPKVETPEELLYLAEGLSQFEKELDIRPGTIRLLAIIETARGVINLREIAGCTDRLVALIFGAEDLTASMGATRTAEGDEIAYARSAVVLHAAAFGLQAIDTPYVTLGNLDGLRSDAVTAMRMGYNGKLAIHPEQVEPIIAAFTPGDQEIRRAQRLLEAHRQMQMSGQGVFVFEGRMVDTPMIRRAENVLARAKAAGKI